MVTIETKANLNNIEEPFSVRYDIIHLNFGFDYKISLATNMVVIEEDEIGFIMKRRKEKEFLFREKIDYNLLESYKFDIINPLTNVREKKLFE